MIAKKLSVSDFRNIEKAEIDFKPGVNLLFGNNAEGKTNAMEALYYFARGKSFRTPRDGDLIRSGKEFFALHLLYGEDEKKENELYYAVGRRERVRKKDGAPVSRASEMIGDFRAVLFCPEHLSLIKGGPEERRAFLNIAIAQCYPAYIPLYAAYKQILDNRNFLLKTAQKNMSFDAEELSVWSEKQAEVSAAIYEYRKKYIDKLRAPIAEALSVISDGKEEVSLLYESDVSEGESPMEIYKHRLSHHLDREIAVGYSLFGVQRDDLNIVLNGESSRVFASQGQQRSLVLALKMAEGEVSREVGGSYPVFLYDDVLSELDEKRQKAVLENSGERQIIVTSCTPDIFGSAIENRIEVKGGTYVSSRG